MNTEDDEPPGRGLDEFRDQFVRAIEKQPPRRKLLRRRTIGALAGVLVVGGSAVAVAEVVTYTTPSEEIAILTKTNTLGFINLETNELIRCPDGEPLIETYEKAAKCDDGSVPEVFREQVAAFERWSENEAEFAQPVSDGPDFAVELDE